MDGVLTDGTLLITESASQKGQYEWLRKMHVRDGFALQLAVRMHYEIIVISGSHSAPVHDRLTRLGINHVFFNIKDKTGFLSDFYNKNGFSFKTSLYMGDDIPDLEVMKHCFATACPSDACDEIKQISDYISPFKGGEGCVRDVISRVMKLQGKWNKPNDVTST